LITTFAFSQWTWQNPLPQGNLLTSVCFTDINTGYAVGSAGTVIKTIDGGTTWTCLTDGVDYNLSSVFFVSMDTGFAVGFIPVIRNKGSCYRSVNWIRKQTCRDSTR
jgi:photosystem II stability/assembly factor-like uncharacterized protein